MKSMLSLEKLFASPADDDVTAMTQRHDDDNDDTMVDCQYCDDVDNDVTADCHNCDDNDDIMADCHDCDCNDNDVTADCHGAVGARPPCGGASGLWEEMRWEQCRLQTLLHSRTLADARALAGDGFYARQGGRGIRCAFCGMEATGVSSAQDVRKQHRRAKGRQCPLLRGERDAEETAAKVVMMTYYSSNSNSSSQPGMEPMRRETHHGSTDRWAKGGRGNLSHHTAGRSVKSRSHRTLQASPGHRSTPRTSSGESPCVGHTSTSRASLTSHDSRSPTSRDSRSRHHLAQTRTSCASSCREGRSGAGEDEERHQGRRDRTLSTKPSHPAPSGESSSTCSTWADIVHTARLPHMMAYQTRLHTFSTWPLLHPTPHNLARAGFFRDTGSPSSGTPPASTSPASTSSSSAPGVCPVNGEQTGSGHCAERARGEESFQAGRPSSPHGCVRGDGSRSSGGQHGERLDSVRCFWCGQRVHQWQKSDDPVLEHARLSPGCRYVIQLLGRQLHDDVIKTSASHHVD